MRIGLFGGTFNPVHYGHLILAQSLRRQAGLDRVIFLPAGVPPHKRRQTDIAPARHRLAMLRLALKDSPGFSVSDWETRRPLPSYTVAALRHFKRIFPKDELFFMIGSDNLPGLKDWFTGWNALSECSFLVGRRPGAGVRRGMIPARYRDKVRVYPTTLIDLSSRELRQWIRKGIPVHFKIPFSVERYIERNRLYR